MGHEITRNIDLYLASINLAGLKALVLMLVVHLLFGDFLIPTK